MQFEKEVTARWSAELAHFKTLYTKSGREEPAIQSEDMAALRYLYLDQLDIQHDLIMRKIKHDNDADQEEAAATAEASGHETQLILDSAGDESEAYLAYAGKYLSKTEEPAILVQSCFYQLRLFASVLKDAIQQSSIQRTPKTNLMNQFAELSALLHASENEDNLKQAVDLSLDHIQNYYLECSRPEDRFQILPFTGSLIEVLSRSRVQLNSGRMKQLDAIKRAYFDNAYDRLAYQLQHAFAWRSGKKWYHQIERKAAKGTADAILACVENDEGTNIEKFRRLYKTLLIQQYALKDKLLFGLLHENASKTIDKALASLEHLALSEKTLKISVSQIREEAEQEALVHFYLRQFDEVLAKSTLQNEDIAARIQSIKQTNPTLFVFDELLHALPLTCVDLITSLNQIKARIQDEVPNGQMRLNFAKLAALKQQQWKKEMPDLFCGKISLHTVHTGFREYGEMTVEVTNENQKNQWESLGFIHISNHKPALEKIKEESEKTTHAAKHDFLLNKYNKLLAKNKVIYVKHFNSPKELFDFGRDLNKLQLIHKAPLPNAFGL